MLVSAVSVVDVVVVFVFDSVASVFVAAEVPVFDAGELVEAAEVAEVAGLVLVVFALVVFAAGLLEELSVSSSAAVSSFTAGFSFFWTGSL